MLKPGTGKATLRLPYPGVHKLDLIDSYFHPFGKPPTEHKGRARHRMDSHWRVLLNLCAALKRTKVDYNVQWEFVEPVVTANEGTKPAEARVVVTWKQRGKP
jgi:hypothetical protein